MRRILSACWSMIIAVVSHLSEAIILHRSLATRSEVPLFRVRAVSLQPRQPKPKPREDLPHLVRRLVEYGWDYDRICHRVEREFPPPATTALERRNHREWIARLIVRYRYGESASPALPQ